MEFSEYDTAHTLWPTFTFHYKYKDFEKIQADLVADIYKQVQKQETDIDSQVATNAKHNLLESKFNFLETNTPSIQNLNQFFNESLLHVMHEGLPSTGYWKPQRNMECVIGESWYHITKQNGYHKLHTHPGSSWASIFYIQTSECEVHNGSNTWYNHNMHQNAKDDGGEWNYMNSSYVIPPRDGHLIVFPAWLPHDAVPYRGTEDRIVVSANVNFFYR